ncbi:P-loop ATPase, Sll1717 family [Agrobacterium tumefaciens]|uniref:P-loop ATPase, Sll1717 family n=1 Tax=Agrobacterium tumefaciens TaxID=358 RepID=UPI00023A5769|nr:hypothetical protein AT5A_26815 [Agrobacterium tumefaciens 5A]
MTATFQDFYKGMGFTEFPFSILNAESEGEKGSDLFVSTSKYGPIIEGFLSGNTMIITGDRGSGKTAIILDFIRKFRTDERLSSGLFVSINDFSSLKSEFSSGDLYKFAIEEIAKEIFTRIARQDVYVSKLGKDEKVGLTYFLHHFVPASTKAELRKKIESIQIGKMQRLLTWCYRVLRFPANVGINAVTHFVSDILSKSLGGSGSPETAFREYLPDVDLSPTIDFNDVETSFAKLKELVALSRKLGFGRVVLIMDKIDEDPRFHSAAEEIAAFVEPIVSDTKFLLDQDMQVVIALWIAPFNMIKDKVRTQKVYCAALDWSSRDLEAALNRRTNVYSNLKINSFHELFSEDVTSDTLAYLFRMANKNPRDLWHIMSYIMYSQYDSLSISTKIENNAINSGLNDFVQKFNYYENYPRKANAKASSMDAYGYIKHLLKLSGDHFTRNQLNDAAGTGSSTLNYCVGMENLGLIEKDGSSSGNINYRIRDPKVTHAITNGLDISKSG